MAGVTRTRVATVIAAPREQVWAAVRDIASHVRWMEDAVSIRFLSDQRAGVGARFLCETKLGPFRLDDHMEVVGWQEGEEMAICHRGLVSGTGRFVLEDSGSATLFSWEEDLRLPRRLGGAAGGLVARPLLERAWRRNLQNLRALVEKDSRTGGA
jgi:uncharacterized protein YndB with AHSA1/START domain